MKSPKTSDLYSVIIPCFNEERSILKTISDIEAVFRKDNLLYEIIVVNDGSFDRTGEIVKSKCCPNITFIELPKNIGKGYAVKTGVLHANGDFIIFYDANSPIPAREILKLINLKKRGDVLIASRFKEKNAIKGCRSLSRTFLSLITRKIIKLVFFSEISDPQCGLKLFSRKAALIVFGQQKIATKIFDLELLIISKQVGFNIYETAVESYYSERLESKVHFNEFFKIIFDLIILKWGSKKKQ